MEIRSDKLAHLHLGKPCEEILRIHNDRYAALPRAEGDDTVLLHAPIAQDAHHLLGLPGLR